MKVLINGFGRIGRSVLRAWALETSLWPGLDIVAINDIAPPEMCAYLFEFDSIFGPWKGRVRLDDGRLWLGDKGLGDKGIALTQARDLSKLDLSEIDLVMECTGRADDRAVAVRGLSAGARRVLISGPSDAADFTVVLGASEAGLADKAVVSNASCTTNALAPLVKLIDTQWGVVTGSMTTVHCYTGSQPTIDAPAADFSRSRAAALSMVPTTTSAQHLLDRVLPSVAGRIMGSAVRVPVASVSCVDLAIMTDRPASAEAANAVFRRAGGVIGATDRALVSTDLRARSESIIMACPQTRVTSQGMLRVFGWYDNEWGFSNRMLDVARRMGSGV
jgi:glyceraldehyde 3-phosphate dehydrogenase